MLCGSTTGCHRYQKCALFVSAHPVERSTALALTVTASLSQSLRWHPGEHVARDGQKRKPSGKSAWTPDLQRWRKRLGVTVREVIEAGLFAIEEEQEKA